MRKINFVREEAKMGGSGGEGEEKQEERQEEGALIPKGEHKQVLSPFDFRYTFLFHQLLEFLTI